MAVREYDRLRKSADDDRDRAKELIKRIAGRRLLLHGLLLLGLISWRSCKWVAHRAAYGLLSNATGRMALALSVLFLLLASGFTGEAILAYTGLWTVILLAGAALYGARAYSARRRLEESDREVIKAKVPGHSERYPADLSFSRYRLLPFQEGRWMPHPDFNFRVPSEMDMARVQEIEQQIVTSLRATRDTTFFLDWRIRESGRCYVTAVPGLPDWITHPALWGQLDEIPGGEKAGPWMVPVAVSARGVVYWDPRKVPHLLAAGTTGAGKSVAQRTIYIHALGYPDHWHIYGLDPKRVELSSLRQYDNVKRIATDPADMAEVVGEVLEVMRDRYAEMELAKGQKSHIHELDPNRELVLLLVDEMAALTMGGGGKSEKAKEKASLAEDMKDDLEEIAQEGRAAGVHLCICTQQPGVADGVMSGTMRMNLSGRLAVGFMPHSSSRMALTDSDAAANPLQGELPGRAIYQAHSDMQRCQVVLTEWTHIDEQQMAMGYESIDEY